MPARPAGGCRRWRYHPASTLTAQERAGKRSFFSPSNVASKRPVCRCADLCFEFWTSVLLASWRRGLWAAGAHVLATVLAEAVGRAKVERQTVAHRLARDERRHVRVRRRIPL